MQPTPPAGAPRPRASGSPSARPRGDAQRLLPRPLVVAGIVVGVAAVSTSSILVRVADAPSLGLAFWRCALGAVVLAPFAVRARRRAAALDRAQRRQLVGSGLLLALHFALFMSALSFTTVASAAVLITSSPLFVGAGAALFLGEPPTRASWAGIALATVGAVVIGAADLLADVGGAAFGGRALLGDAMAFTGAAAVAGYLLLGRAARRRLPLSLYAVAVYGVAAVALLVACVATGAPLAGYHVGTWLAIGGLVVGPQLLGHTVFNALLGTVSASVVAVAALAEPIGATLLAWLVLAELPVPWFWLGAPIVLCGVWIAVAGGRARAPDAADPVGEGAA